MGQEVMERHGLVVQGIGPRLGPVGHKALRAPGGHWGGGWAVGPAVGGGCFPGSSLPSLPPLTDRGPECGAAGGGLCALHELPLPPLLLGNRELIQPATHLPFLVPAEDEPAKPKLLMLGLRLGAGPGPWRPGWSGTGGACLQGRRDAPARCHTALVPQGERTRGSHESLLL